MAWNDWTDGDVLYSANLKEQFNRNMMVGLWGDTTASTKVVGFDFTSDNMQTKTNLTYDADEDLYYGTNSNVVLETPSRGGGSFQGNYDAAVLNFNTDVYTIYDECDDESFDTSKFNSVGVGLATGPTDTEHSDGYAQTTGTTDSTSDTLELEIDNNGIGWSTSQKFMIRYNWTSENSSNSGLRMKGTTSGSVNIKVKSGVTSETVSAEVWVDVTNDLATLYVDGVFSSVVDISSLVGNYYFSVFTQSAGQPKTFTIKVYYVRIKQGDETTTYTQSFSSDNGTNYTEANGNTATLLSNKGYATRIKLISTVAADEMIVIKNCSYIPLSSDDKVT